MYGYYPFDYPYLNGLKTDYIDYDSRPPDYANAVAKMIRDSGEFKDSFLIAIGELNLSTLNSIANSLGIPNSDFSSHVFKANDELNFYIAVESIAESISVEIEEVLGAELLQNAQD
jgi:hypothetical protein